MSKSTLDDFVDQSTVLVKAGRELADGHSGRLPLGVEETLRTQSRALDFSIRLLRTAVENPELYLLWANDPASGDGLDRIGLPKPKPVLRVVNNDDGPDAA